MTTIAPQLPRLGLLIAAVAALCGAVPAVAAPGAACSSHGPRHDVDTLTIVMSSPQSLRHGSPTPVTVQVRRVGDLAIGGMEADVVVRVITDGMVSYNSGVTDPQGNAVIAVTVDGRTLPGKATLAVDAWTPQGGSHGCVPTVAEHGHAERATQVSRF